MTYPPELDTLDLYRLRHPELDDLPDSEVRTLLDFHAFELELAFNRFRQDFEAIATPIVEGLITRLNLAVDLARQLRRRSQP